MLTGNIFAGSLLLARRPNLEGSGQRHLHSGDGAKCGHILGISFNLSNCSSFKLKESGCLI